MGEQTSKWKVPNVSCFLPSITIVPKSALRPGEEEGEE